jgi:membrane protease YdiL (CAAX protease family)
MSRRAILITAWVVTLLVSILPDVILNEIFKVSPNWLFPAKLGLLALALVVSLAWKPIRPLWQYFLVFLLLYFAEEGVHRVGEIVQWKTWFVYQAPFTVSMLGTQLLRIMVAIFMVVVMLVLKRKFSEFYLVKGNLGAEAKPIPVLMSKPESWKKLGIILSVCVTGGTLLFLFLAGRPSLGVLGAALPMFPMILLLAAMNAFSEEMNYRATVLGALKDVTTGPQAVMLAAVFFGIGHYYGVPYGIIGVIMAWFLGWLLGKSMIETKGFFWAWFIHFLQDVVIFSFMAIGSVTPGGG